ncbi:centrosomal protein of 164 kDa-like [Lampris incognitus]|uniref:centrosomal protein of 164 kDa-like n=1 Tax=Lampris incognitus TaxID=2546036 RepID=UPI0024B4C195|nr:centrosomal protein of 164 kDa-like [Lampris incognitus]
MSAPALIGNQLILEEDYDENYIPSDQEIHEYAREIGMDPDSEPELLWLAREGIVAPLPREWKPCQDVTGDLYYFNFSTGQSTWDHPCDEHYRSLVVQERERVQLTAAVSGGPGGKKDKEKKKKKEKKEKKEKKKEPLNTGPLSLTLGPLPSSLGSLAPLRGLDAPGLGPLPGSTPALRGSLGNPGGLEPLKTSLGGPRSSGGSSVLSSRQEERVSPSLPGLDDDDNNDGKMSETEPSTRGSARLLKNLHLDLDALGGGLQYENSEASGGLPAEERTEPELQDLVLSGDHSPEPPSRQDSRPGRHLHLSTLLGSRDCDSMEGAGPTTLEEEEEEVEEESGVGGEVVQGDGGVEERDVGEVSEGNGGIELEVEGAEGEELVSGEDGEEKGGGEELGAEQSEARKEKGKTENEGGEEGEAEGCIQSKREAGESVEIAEEHVKGREEEEGDEEQVSDEIVEGWEEESRETKNKVLGDSEEVVERSAEEDVRVKEDSQEIEEDIEEQVKEGEEEESEIAVERGFDEKQGQIEKLISRDREESPSGELMDESSKAVERSFGKEEVDELELGQEERQEEYETPERCADGESGGEESEEVVERSAEEDVRVTEDSQEIEEDIEEQGEQGEEGEEEEREIAVERGFDEKKGKMQKPISRDREESPSGELVDESGKVVERSFGKEEVDEFELGQEESHEEYEAPERCADGESGGEESEKEEVERCIVIEEEGQEKEKVEDEDNGESDEDLERCSLSQKQMTEDGEESDEEAVERCVWSEGRESGGGTGDKKGNNSDQTPQIASESEDKFLEKCTVDLTSAKLTQRMAMFHKHYTSDEKEKTQFTGRTKPVTQKYPLPAEVGFGLLWLCDPSLPACSYFPSPPSPITQLLHTCKGPHPAFPKSNSTALGAVASIMIPTSYLDHPITFEYKVSGLKDFSATVSPLETDERKETKDERLGERTKRAETAKRRMQATGKDNPSSPRVDMLLLHQSSPVPSLSSSSHSERAVGFRPKAEGLSASLALQRPETSRGRLVRSSNAQLREFESPMLNQENSLGENPSTDPPRTTCKDKRGSEETGQEHKEEERRKKMVGVEREEEDEREQEWRQEERERESRKAEKEVEEEKECITRDKEKRIRLLREELRREEEEEENKLKEESEERVRALRQFLQSKRREEEDRLNEESDRRLEDLRETARRERENQQCMLREECEATLKELHFSIEAEQAAEQDRLEAERRRDLARLKADAEEKLQAERQRLLAEQEEKMSTLRQEVKSSERRRELLSPRPEQQLVEYQRELADVLQEVREEVQRDHSRKLEQLREEHRRELDNIREKHLDEEAAQREHLLCTLKEDKERLQVSHTLALEKLRLQIDTQKQKAQLTHTRTESELRDLAEQLELRAKELKNQEALLQTKAADLKRRRRKLGEEEEEVDRVTEALPRLIQERDRLKEQLDRAREETDRARELMQRAREERSEAKEEVERIRMDRDKAREESRRMKEDKERLENKLELLQERCERLSCRVSELEQGKEVRISPKPRREQEDKKGNKTEVEAPSSARRDASLHVDDLEDPPVSPVPDSHSSLDDLRRYICSENMSIQKARLFLESENSHLMERQAALRAAQASSSKDLNQEAGVTQELVKNLQQESSDVEVLRQAVQRGSALLRTKEEHLQQLETSIAEEPLLEELSRVAADRKVTFDVTDSDLSSTADPQDGAGGYPAVPAKVQQLAESLQQISGQLNTVLSALGSLAQRQSTIPYPAFSLPQSWPHSTMPPATGTSVPMPQSQRSGAFAPPPSLGLPGRSWAWGSQGGHTATPVFSTSIANGPRACEDLISSHWAQLFPGAAMDPVASSTIRTSSTHSAYTTSREHARSLLSTHKSVEVDGQRLQGLIDGNKRWLEMRRKDNSIPLFTRYRTPSTMNGLVQLGLDDNNQIKVYHY